IRAVKLRKTHEKIVRTDAAEVDPFVIVAVAVIKIEILVPKEWTGSEVGIDARIEVDWNSMNSDLKSDNSFLGDTNVTVVWANTSPRYFQQSGKLSFPVRYTENSIDA